jgi:hypothetical protein
VEEKERRQRENERKKKTRKISAYMGALLKHFLFTELITRSYNMRHKVGGGKIFLR